MLSHQRSWVWIANSSYILLIPHLTLTVIWHSLNEITRETIPYCVIIFTTANQAKVWLRRTSGRPLSMHISSPDHMSLALLCLAHSRAIAKHSDIFYHFGAPLVPLSATCTWTASLSECLSTSIPPYMSMIYLVTPERIVEAKISCKWTYACWVRSSMYQFNSIQFNLLYL